MRTKHDRHASTIHNSAHGHHPSPGRALFSRWDWRPTLTAWGWCPHALLTSRWILCCPCGPLLRSHAGAGVLARLVALCWCPLPALTSSAGAALHSLLSFSCACAHLRALLSHWGRCPRTLSPLYYAAGSVSRWHRRCISLAPHPSLMSAPGRSCAGRASFIRWGLRPPFAAYLCTGIVAGRASAPAGAYARVKGRRLSRWGGCLRALLTSY